MSTAHPLIQGNLDDKRLKKHGLASAIREVERCSDDLLTVMECCSIGFSGHDSATTLGMSLLLRSPQPWRI